MKTKQKNTPKKQYLHPTIDIIEIDNEISLALESEPADGPNENLGELRKNSSSDNPFKTNYV
jgi:hypothetical protein